MVVRGAPAIGATGAYGMAIAARDFDAEQHSNLIDWLNESKQLLDAARPTAVNLTWATTRMMRVATELNKMKMEAAEIARLMMDEAQHLADQDIVVNRTMAR